LSTLTAPLKVHDPARARRKGVALVFGCTILGAAAQILMKTGANQLVGQSLSGILSNVPLLAGYCLYGLSTLLLVLALRDGELSLLYPVIALTYVWVTILSRVIFHDQLSVSKVTGIAVIIAGVVVLGRNTKE